MSYYTLRESFTSGTFRDETKRELYNFTDYSKVDPLSSQPIIRANLAGYHKTLYDTVIDDHKKKEVEYKMVVPHASFFPQDYPVTYPCTTIYPKNTEYTKTKSVNIAP